MSRMAQHSNRIAATGAILAGGLSTRMGTPKPQVILSDGRPMFDWVRDSLAACCRRIVVVGEDGIHPDMRRIHDLRPNRGPLGGIEALLDSGLDEQYLVVPCDVPLITPQVLNALLVPTGEQATMFTGNPLPLRISARAEKIISDLLDDEIPYGLHHALEATGALELDLPDEWRPALMNVNTPADVAGLGTSHKRQA